MKNYIKHLNLRPGDEIIVPKSKVNWIQHHALYLGYDENGTDLIIENSYGVGVRLITASDFFSMYPHVNEIRQFTGTDNDRLLLVQKALKSIGKPYNLIVYNCQHFTSEIKNGKKVSKQVENTLVGLGVLVIIGVFFGE